MIYSDEGPTPAVINGLKASPIGPLHHQRGSSHDRPIVGLTPVLMKAVHRCQKTILPHQPQDSLPSHLDPPASQPGPDLAVSLTDKPKVLPDG